MRIIGVSKRDKKTSSLKKIHSTKEGYSAGIILCAGAGRRAGKENKLLRNICGKSAIHRCLELFANSPSIEKIALIVSEDTETHAKQLIDAMRLEKRCMVINGGSSRGESSYFGLKALSALQTPPSVVAIHDAARCLLHPETLENCLQSARENGSGVAAINAVDTILKANENAVIVAELNRAELIQVQTPQAFAFEPMWDCYRDAYDNDSFASDDSALMLRKGYAVQTVEGRKDNIKITHPEDFALAEHILAQRAANASSTNISISNNPSKSQRSSRAGIGEDTHRLVVGRKLIIGGVDIPFDRGLAGHSDADVLTHAIMDALLGAAALGDIGRLFPDSDDRFKNISSIELLKKVNHVITQRTYEILNIDAVITAEAPKISPYADEMIKNIAAALNIPTSCVSIKATTSEGLGYAGRGEGIAARAIAMISGT